MIRKELLSHRREAVVVAEQILLQNERADSPDPPDAIGMLSQLSYSPGPRKIVSRRISNVTGIVLFVSELINAPKYTRFFHDLIWFSRRTAALRDSNSSVYTRTQGLYGRVDLDIPALC